MLMDEGVCGAYSELPAVLVTTSNDEVKPRLSGQPWSQKVSEWPDKRKSPDNENKMADVR